MAIKVYRDGRTVLTGRDYTLHKLKLWEGQGRMCAGCGLYVPLQAAVLDHYAGRGMMGSKRDDLDPRNKVMHKFCHDLKHYQERDLAAVVWG